MKAREFITEIDRLSASDYNPVNWTVYPEIANLVRKPLPGYADLVYVIYGDFYKSKDFQITVLDKNNPTEIVGNLYLGTTANLPQNTMSSFTVSVNPKYRKRGIAKAMYKLVLLPKPQGLGITLLSDTSQTIGGVRTWAGLASIPGVEITGLVSLYNYSQRELNKYANLSKTYEEILSDLLGKVGGVYFGESGLYIYFQIPVKMVGKKLENAVRNSLIKIYGTFGTLHFQTRLMARYVGDED